MKRACKEELHQPRSEVCPSHSGQVRGRAEGSIGQAAQGNLADQLLFDARVLGSGRVDETVPVFRARALGPCKEHGRSAVWGGDPGPAFPFVRMLVSVQTALNEIRFVGLGVKQEDLFRQAGTGRAGVPEPSVQGMYANRAGPMPDQPPSR